MSKKHRPVVPKDKPYDATNEATVDEAEQKAERDRLRILDAYRQVLSTRPGRDLLYYIIGMCGVFDLSMTGNSWTHFNEGKRQVGLTLLGDLDEIDKVVFLKMQREELERQLDAELPHFEETEEDVAGAATKKE